jgi:hypothetical protein
MFAGVCKSVSHLRQTHFVNPSLFITSTRSAMSTTPPASSSRARPPARRKPNTADDAPYIGPSINAGAKRQAGAPPNDGDPKKRRKDDVSSMRGPASTGMPIRRPELFMPSELPVSRVRCCSPPNRAPTHTLPSGPVRYNVNHSSSQIPRNERHIALC